MIKLREGEKIIAAVHRHWIVIACKMTAIIFLLLPILIILIFISYVPPQFAGLVLYMIVIYCLAVLFLAFRFWVDYYLDMWILTTNRLIDIEQIGLFQRSVAEIPLFRIQDVSISVNGFIATFLKFGTIKIQTAGEQDFYIKDIPKVYKIKDLIISQVQKTNR